MDQKKKKQIQEAKPLKARVKKIPDKLIIPEKKKGSIYFIIIAFCIPVLLYLQTINFGFTGFDDDGIIVNNISFLSDIGNAPHAFLKDQFINKD